MGTTMATDYCRQIKEFSDLGYTEFASPAFSMDPSDPAYLNSCVYPFFEEVAKDSQCRDLTKILAWHMYTPCDSQSNIEQFCTNRADQWASVYNKVNTDHQFGITGTYVTEYAGWYEGCVKDSDPTGAQGQALVAQYCTPVLKNHKDVSRFAWFNDFGSYAGQGTSDLWNSDDTVSDIGKAFFAAIKGDDSEGPSEKTNDSEESSQQDQDSAASSQHSEDSAEPSQHDQDSAASSQHSEDSADSSQRTSTVMI